MRQAGGLAAAALVALQESPARLHEDHENARLLARSLAGINGVGLDPEKVFTNIIIFDITKSGIDSLAFLSRLHKIGILAVPVGQTKIRMVTHCDVTRADIELAIERLEKSFNGAG
jgi:threonine aldolase